MAKTPQSRKAKGRRLQQDIRDKFLEHFPTLEKDDVVSTPMGSAGSDLWLSPAARKIIPYSVECKSQEALSIWAALKQAEDNTKEHTHPVLIFNRNRSKTYAVIEVDHFIQLIKLRENLPTNES